MKQIFKISSLLVVVLLLFCSCSSSDKAALIVGEGQVYADVYAYFLDYVIINDNEDEKTSEKELKEKANDLCLNYIKINTKYSDMKLSLSAAKKAQIAKEVTNNWAFFGSYYKSIGVSKQTLTNIAESDAFKEDLLLAIYDTNGTNPIGEDSLKEYFKENYIFFKAINGYLKTTDEKGNEVAKSEEQIAAVTENFNSMAKSITSENTIDAVNLAYLQSIGDTGTGELPISVINKTSKTYPSGFFEQVVSMSAGEVKVVSFDDYIFIVQRFDNFDETQAFYTNYRTICLKEMANADFEKTIDGWFKDSKSESISKVQDKCYEQIISVRESNKSEK
ncbi:MAG: hypothetical protein EOM05_03150 [Clostridia bacterium]|nr:hypothetical protein [Clostridia bacterium]